MKKVALLIFAIFLLPSLLAIDLNIEKTSSNEVVIRGINQPAIFTLNITNLEASGSFSIYNLLGFNMAPREFDLDKGETTELNLSVYPRDDLEQEGFYTLEYYIKNKLTSDTQTETLTMKLITLNNAFEVGSEVISPETNSLEIYISNKVNFNFNEVDVNFKSAFFDIDKKVSLKPYGKETFVIQLNKEDFKKLIAGFYTLTADVNVDGKNARVEGTIKFAEQDILTTTKEDYGIVINTQVIKKVNEGNVVANSETIIKKNIISRLFTSFSPEPDVVEREGATVYYTWSKRINPGDSLEIRVKTNWLLPLLIIFFIVTIVFFAKQYSKTNLVLKKRVNFVRTKGGEFALKVSIVAIAKNYVDRVSVIDRLPPMMKLYEKFGGEKPARINEQTRRIEWELGSLEIGETRFLSYVVYSKVGVMGKFALPGATAVYEKDGQIHETESNKAFFVAEQRGKDIEE